jgi:hypothetical protein
LKLSPVKISYDINVKLNPIDFQKAMFLVIKGFILRSSKLYQYYVRQELMKSSIKYFLFAILLIIIDQVIKLWMHFVVIPDHFGEMQLIPGFLKLHYITNKGMAFGMELGGSYGKLALTLFRLVAYPPF